MQTLTQSAVETIAGTVIGFGVSYLATLAILPEFGYPVTHAADFGITSIFTVLSLLRGMAVRRLFARWHA